MDGAADPLSELRDIHLPDPVSWWPPAPGWWMVSAILLVVIALGVWSFRHVRRPTPYRTAQQELHGLRESFAANQQIEKLVVGLSVLLRRYAIACYGRKRVAGLTGDQWLSFLNETGRTSEFTAGAGRVLASVPYGSRETVKGYDLLRVVEEWLKTTRRRKS